MSEMYDRNRTLSYEDLKYLYFVNGIYGLIVSWVWNYAFGVVAIKLRRPNGDG